MASGRDVTPARGRLLRFLGLDAEADTPVERHGFNLDIEALAVGVLPGTSDSSPDGFTALPVADVVGGVAWCFRG